MLQEKKNLPKLPSLKWNSSCWYWCNQPQRRPTSHLFLFSGSICLQQDNLSHQCALSTSRRSPTRRTRLHACPHPCFYTCHLQRLASCVITHSRRLLTNTPFTNPSLFTHSGKVDLINLVCRALSFHSRVSVNVLKTCVYNREKEKEATKCIFLKG